MYTSQLHAILFQTGNITTTLNLQITPSQAIMSRDYGDASSTADTGVRVQVSVSVIQFVTPGYCIIYFDLFSLLNYVLTQSSFEIRERRRLKNQQEYVLVRVYDE